MSIDRANLHRIARRACVSALLLVAAGQAMAQTPARSPAPPKAQAAVKPQVPAAAEAAVKPQAPVATDASGSRAPEAADGGDVIARVGTTNVSVSDVRAYVEQFAPRDRAALARDPALLSQAVRMMLGNQLVLKEALAKGFDQQPAVAAQLERVRQAAIVESYLQSVTALPTGYPSETEIENLYDANKNALLVPRQFRIAQIFIALAQGADKDAEDRARHKLEETQKKLRQPGADFGAIAHADSDDREGAEHDGELSWLAETQIRPEIRAQVMGLAKNAVSDPVRLEDGWHLVRLIDTKAAYTRPLAEVHDQLAQKLRDERVAANRRAYLAELLKQTPPAINELALSKVLGATDKEQPSR